MNHLYQRLDNRTVVKHFHKMLNESEINIATELYDNLTRDCNTHREYKQLQETYLNRIKNK